MSFNLHTDYNGKITKKDLKKVFWRSIPMEHSWNYERMDNVGYAWVLYPVLKKLYPDEKDLAKAMLSLIENEKLCNEFKNNSYENAKNYDLSKIVKEYEELYFLYLKKKVKNK